jgi:selenocysteine lyase/cysteine desulfurase
MSRLNRRRFVSLFTATAVNPPGLSSALTRSLQQTRALSFPALGQQIGGRPLTYLDSAATTLRPQAVVDAVADFYATDNANPAPVHTLARRAASRLTEARRTVARFINASSPNEVVFPP